MNTEDPAQSPPESPSVSPEITAQSHSETPAQSHSETPAQSHSETPAQSHSETPAQSHSETSAPAVTGNLDSEFFLELVGTKTQIPQPGDTHSDNSSGDRFTDLDAGTNQNIEVKKTKIPLHKQGATKTLLLLGVVSLPMGLVLWMMFGNTGAQSQVSKAPEPQASPPAKEYESDPRFPVVQTKLAIQEQEQQLLAAANKSQQDADAAKIATNGTTAPSPTSNPPVAKVTQPAKSATPVTPAPEVITPKSPPTNVQPPILPSPTPTPAVAKVEPKPSVKPIETVIKPVKPVIVATRSSTVVPNVPATRTIPPSGTQSAPTPKPTPPPQVSWQEATNGAVAVIGSRVDETVAIVPQSPSGQISSNSSPSGRRIIAGQNRIASLITPFQAISGEQSQEVLLNLEQGFVDTRGGMSIPANTKIQAQITVASNGMLRIGDAKIAIGGEERSISLGNLMLVGTNNQPLVAELKQFNNDEINRRDMQTALIGGLQGLGKILTQSNSQTQITTSGTAISTTTSNPNVLGGVLDGASSTLVQQWAQRNQAQIQRLENNARVWFLPSGSKVSLYTTKSFEIN
jgi:hypothetical protein